MAYLSGYSKYKVLTLTGGASGALTDHQLKLAVSYEAAMQGDFDDLRFTQADGTTLVDAWAELIVTDTSATVWVEFPTTPANTVEQIYRMYYGNAAAASDWDIGATFVFGDDLESGNLNAWGGATSAYGAVGGAAYKGSYGCDRTQADGSWQFLTGSGDIQNGVWEAWVRQGNSASYPGTRVRYLDGSNYVDFTINSAGSEIGLNDVGGTGNHTATLSTSTATWYLMQAILNGTSATLKVYNTSMGLLQTLNATVADRTDAFGFKCYRDAQFDDFRVRKYAANPPTYAFGAEQSVPSVGAIMKQFQKANIGADLYNGAIIA